MKVYIGYFFSSQKQVKNNLNKGSDFFSKNSKSFLKE
jgi:hypothetical protein